MPQISAAELKSLRAASERLEQLHKILPPIIAEGFVRRLNELPATPQPAFAWHGLSNAELRECEAPGATYEKLRRSFAGLQCWNAGQAPMKRCYPTPHLLSRIANCNMQIARQWAGESLVAYELHGYALDLAPDLAQEAERDEHNALIAGELGARIESLVSWPAEYE